MDFDPIPHDFDVQLLCENIKERLYGKAENLFFHFILIGKNNEMGYQTLSQFFFPRLGFSLAMLAHYQSSKNPVAVFNRKDLFPEYLRGYDPVGYEAENGPEFFLDFGQGPLSLGMKSRNSVTSAILNDGIWFKKFATTNEPATAQSFLDANPNKKREKSSDDILNMAKKLHVLPDLEYGLSKGGKREKHQQDGFLELVLNAATAKPDISEDMLDHWVAPLMEFGNNTSCDCGNDYCFFEIAKKMQLKYFPDTYEDPDAVKSFWKKLTVAQKSVLIFMYSVEGLTPLVAQNIFEENFDIGYLSELLCTEHQPDSPVESEIRKNIALNDYFWRKQFAT